MAESDQYSGLNRRYLRVQDLRMLRRAVFAARRPVEGLYAGRHASRMRGQSAEFSDYRPYLPGDEIGDIDWKVYGRSDKLFIKLFEHQADMTVNLLVDASGSMAFRGVNAPSEATLATSVNSWIRGLRTVQTKLTPRRIEWPSKYDQACLLAAAIAFLITQQQDRVGLGFAAGGLAGHIPAGGSAPHLIDVLRGMEAMRPQGPANLAGAIRDLAAASTRKRALLVVFSDLYEDRDEIVQAMSVWRHRGGEAILFHVLHADEMVLPDVGSGQFVDSESGARLRLSSDDVRSEYGAKLREFLEGWANACRGGGIDYNRVSTAESYTQALRGYLFSRAAAR